MECRKCEYNDKELNICKDEKVFVDKNDGEIVCRYNKNAIPFEEYYNEK